MNKNLLDNKIEQFRKLHKNGNLILANVWDGASAKIAEEVGASALATTSAGVSWTLGYSDGHFIKREKVMNNLKTIINGTELPVSVDIENGLLQNNETMEILAQELLDVGCVGVNLEDVVNSNLLSIQDASNRIKNLREATKKLNMETFINARLDVMLLGIENREEDIIKRANSYFSYGADCVFIPGLLDLSFIRNIVKKINGPLNVMSLENGPSAEEFFMAGVTRVSAGSYFSENAYKQTLLAMKSYLKTGNLSSTSNFQFGYNEINKLFDGVIKS